MAFCFSLLLIIRPTGTMKNKRCRKFRMVRKMSHYLLLRFNEILIGVGKRLLKNNKRLISRPENEDGIAANEHGDCDSSAIFQTERKCRERDRVHRLPAILLLCKTHPRRIMTSMMMTMLLRLTIILLSLAIASM